jgi:predicted secreted Zn-dependent protease
MTQTFSALGDADDSTPFRLKKRRATDTTRRDVRNLLARHIRNFGEMHEAAAMLTARAMRPMTPGDRAELSERCASMQRAIASIRVGLIEDFADRPARIAGDAHVTDTEKALDLLERRLQDISTLVAAQR